MRKLERQVYVLSARKCVCVCLSLHSIRYVYVLYKPWWYTRIRTHASCSLYFFWKRTCICRTIRNWWCSMLHVDTSAFPFVEFKNSKAHVSHYINGFIVMEFSNCGCTWLLPSISCDGTYSHLYIITYTDIHTA